MKKIEFLKEMSNKLQEGMTRQEIEEQVRYYSDYIDSEVAKGKKESEVLEELGDPILIARNILSNYQPGRFRQETDSQVQQEHVTTKKISRNGCIMISILAILVVCVLLWLAGSILRLLAPVLVPVLLIVAIVIMINQRK